MESSTDWYVIGVIGDIYFRHRGYFRWMPFVLIEDNTPAVPLHFITKACYKMFKC